MIFFSYHKIVRRNEDITNNLPVSAEHIPVINKHRRYTG